MRSVRTKVILIASLLCVSGACAAPDVSSPTYIKDPVLRSLQTVAISYTAKELAVSPDDFSVTYQGLDGEYVVFAVGMSVPRAEPEKHVGGGGYVVYVDPKTKQVIHFLATQ